MNLTDKCYHCNNDWWNCSCGMREMTMLFLEEVDAQEEAEDELK